MSDVTIGGVVGLDEVSHMLVCRIFVRVRVCDGEELEALRR